MNDQVKLSKLEFVVNVLLTLDNLDYSLEEQKFCGYIPDTSTYKFQEIIDSCHSFYIDTDDSDPAENKIVFDIVDTEVYYTLDDYLKNPKRRLKTKPEKDFYIYESKFYFKVDEPLNLESMPNFLKMARLFDALSTISDFQAYEGNEPYIVFFGNNNLKLNFNYHSSDLNVNFKKVDLLIENYIFSELHHEDKILSLRNALNDCYPEKNIDFSKFLERFEDFYRLVRNNFQLYIDKFSFDDFKIKIEDEKREYLLKINKIFSDMQNQLLTLPIASVIAASQMSKVAGFGDGVKNIALLVGVYIFAYMIRIFAHNQEDSLDAIRSEIEIKKKEIQLKEHSDYQKDYLDICKIGLDRVDTISDKIASVLKLTSFVVLLVTAIFVLRFFI